jgi:lysophospholipase L1-like esterase
MKQAAISAIITVTSAGLALAASNVGSPSRTTKAKTQIVKIVGFIPPSSFPAAPVPLPSPTPSPSPMPSPSPTPAPSPAATLRGVVAEGDSISYKWAGSYTGIYAAARPSVEYHGAAVGGSGISNPSTGNGLMQRLPAVLARQPAVLTILIGANDLTNTSQYPTPEDWLNALWDYVARVKATGAKVAIGTVLPVYFENSPFVTNLHNGRRHIVNAAIRSAVGSKIDAVIDFAADPVIGPDVAARDKKLFSDGIHPTDPSLGAGSGQERMFIVYAPVLNKLIAK